MRTERAEQHSPVTDLSGIIKGALVWSYDATLRSFRASMRDGWMSVPVTKKMLAAAHPKLPAVLRRLVDSEAGNADAVRKTIALWADARPMLVNVGGVRYLAKVHEYYGVTNESLLYISGTLWNLSKLNDGTFFACGGHGVFDLRLTPDTLEAAYPGCTQQLECLAAMGVMSPQEIARTVFAEALSVDAAALPELGGFS